MLRKSSRPVQNQSIKGTSIADQASGAETGKSRAASFFTAPGLFVGLSSKSSVDYDSAMSPTSPLEFRTSTLLGSSLARSRSPERGQQSPWSWDCRRVGLGLVDSLNDETKPCGKVLRFAGSNRIVFGSQMGISIPTPKSNLRTLSDRDNDDEDSHFTTGPKSLPKNYNISSPYSQSGYSMSKLGSVSAELKPADFGKSSLPIFRIMYLEPNSNVGSKMFEKDVLDSQLASPVVSGGKNLKDVSGSIPIPIGPSQGFLGSLSTTEIEQSEDYTCIVSHGPNPKTTHIFGDCILESYNFCSPSKITGVAGERSLQVANCSEDSPPHPDDDFLRFCFSCKKKLEEGKDIYIYGGEKAFCSCECRDEEILIEEEMEKPVADFSNSAGSSFELEILH